MSSPNRPLPCLAYTGKEPYLFISYAHVDSDRVYPEIKALSDQGYRIWYDEGIAPSKEWSEEIAQAIISSSMFIVFISQNAIQSHNVKDEINYSLDKNIPFLPVYLEEVVLTEGLQMRTRRFQAIMKWQISADDYKRKMLNALPGECLGKTQQVSVHDTTHNIAKNTILELPKPGGFVSIKGGTFLMGSPETEAGRRDNETQHQVKVNVFYLAKYPVTVSQFETFINETNYQTDADKDGGSYIWNDKAWDKKLGVNWRCDPKGNLQNDKQHPVIHVSWHDASAYCQWFSKKQSRNFRLPTEAEWEYACRAGTTTPFNTGANLTTAQANYDGNYPYQNYPKGKYLGTTTPVGSYPPNGWGLYDMHGNVWEWCLDWYGGKYYNECKRQGIVDNPQGPETGSDRVLRGGSWGSCAGFCRSAYRRYGDPGNRNYDVGFRLVFLP